MATKYMRTVYKKNLLIIIKRIVLFRHSGDAISIVEMNV